MKATVQFDGSISDSFEMKSGVKQGCVLAPTLFGIFSVLLNCAFKDMEGGVYLHTRSDGKLFNLLRLKAKTKVRKVLIRELLLADDAALIAHDEDLLQELMDRLSRACQAFALTIGIKKTVVLGQGVSQDPSITLNENQLEVVQKFSYLGSTVTTNFSLDEELNIRIGKPATTLSRLTKRVWNNSKLTIKTKMLVYKACVLSTLMYGGETWTTYVHQEKRLNSFHLRCLCRILNIKWQDKVTNAEVLRRANLPSVTALFKQRRLRWLGHLSRLEDGRIPKDMLYGELSEGIRTTGRPKLRYKDTCKRDMKAFGIDPDQWETLAGDRNRWRQRLHQGIKVHDRNWLQRLEEKRVCGKQAAPELPNHDTYTCNHGHRSCKSRIGLFSHMRHCKPSTS
ncbi:uncharacterized protein LOC135360406 [Latimeria chalumnae]|uniref:uncharacterized protein LOC135360406 n=1 Tax=Latimeria chalumnae TaxID=7897 RepID=UPI00313CBAE6